jgi:hypothetical protein
VQAQRQAGVRAAEDLPRHLLRRPGQRDLADAVLTVHVKAVHAMWDRYAARRDGACLVFSRDDLLAEVEVANLLTSGAIRNWVASDTSTRRSRR